MYKRILVPVDGSPFSEEVIPYACGIAQATAAPLTFLRLVSREEEKVEAARYVSALAAENSAEGRTLVASGDLAESILGEARSESGTLIIMTSHGHSGIMEAVMGNVAMRIVRSSKDPVMLYRPHGATNKGHQPPVRITSVLLPIDGSAESESMAAHAADFAKWIAAELSLVQVLQPGAAAASGAPASDVRESSYVQSRADDYHKKHGVKTNWEVLHGDPAEAIARHLKGKRDVLLAMVTRGRRPIEAAVLGSVTAGCLQKSGLPILTRMP